MGGFFAAASKEDCSFDVFFGTDYHSHLGTRRAGMVMFGEDGFERAIHNIENSPFRTKFDKEISKMKGHLGIGCISDYEPQPLIVRSHHGTYAIMTVGKINNMDSLLDKILEGGRIHFQEMSGGMINATELVATLINQQDNLVEGLRSVQDLIEGSMTVLLMTPIGIYLSRDKYGRTPLVVGRRADGYCAAFESFSYLNLGYHDYKELGPGEIAVMTPEAVTTLSAPGTQKKICSFLWIYYGYAPACYEGVPVEVMRNRCGALMARRDMTSKAGMPHIDTVAAIPDSGIGHAIGYSNESGIPYGRPFVKYTPTWPRSFMPTIQSRRNLIAKMKLIPIHEMINGRSLLLIDDSIVRGTQLGETTQFLYESGASEVHIRPACPPLLFGCKYLNFSRSTSEMELIARRVIQEEEGAEVERSILEDYANPDSDRYHNMLEGIRKKLDFTSLAFNRLDDMIEAVGIGRENLCTYCWDGKE